MISEELITLNAEDMGEIWKTGEMEELKDMLNDAGFKFQFIIVFIKIKVKVFFIMIVIFLNIMIL